MESRKRHAWHAQTTDDILTLLGTTGAGLDQAAAAERLRLQGPNCLPRSAADGPLVILWGQINNPIGWLLIAAGCMAVLLGKLSDSVVVFGAVLINAFIGFVQEYRAGRTIAALSALVPRTAIVVRDGQPREIPAEDLVPGDCVTLQSGDQVPADLRLIRIKNLLVDESPLTGESLPVAKQDGPTAADVPLGDRLCMAYSGTMVTQGTATGIVVATGPATELGQINQLLSQTTRLETPLTRQLARISNAITAAVVIIVAILVLFGILIKGALVSEALMVAVSLAAAAIPEGLPAVITIALAIGVRRMADRNAVVRHLPAVETLGSTSVICSDKTGTLTRNEMTVQVVWQAGQEYRISGIGYQPYGDYEHDGRRLETLPERLHDLLTAALLCSDATLRQDQQTWVISGDPTEAALVVAGRKAGLDEHLLRLDTPRLDVVPFESDTKFMATLNSTSVGNRILVKGAPETVLERCCLDDAERDLIVNAIETYARQGMRVIACALRDEGSDQRIVHDSLQSGLHFSGLFGMIDPPRTEAIDAIRVCHEAGITVKMITGDHPITAEAIGRQLNLLAQDQPAIQGRQLEAMTDQEIVMIAASANVFARVAPEHKIRLVRALQSRGQVVAMTGDGVNDAPALKQADIGVAMGITGTAVSKEAATVILVDDNFASIAAAVEEGRRVYDNLIKSLAFVLPTNLGLAGTLTAAMFFFPTVTIDGTRELLMAMSPSQTLWINLVASVTLSIPLAFEILEPGTMRRPPRRLDEPVFSGFIMIRLVLVALLMTMAACGLFLLEYQRVAGSGPVDAARHALAMAEAQTGCVTTITFSQIFYLFQCRSLRDSLFSQGLFSNLPIFIGCGILILLQLCFCYLPPLQALFGSAPLDGWSWLRAAAAGATVLPVISIEKTLWRHFSPPAAINQPAGVQP